MKNKKNNKITTTNNQKIDEIRNNNDDVIDINTSQSQIPNFKELEDTTIDTTCDWCDMTIKDSIDSLNIEKMIKILEQIIKII